MLFEECDRSSSVKNFTDRLNLLELQLDDISQIYCREYEKIYNIQVN